LPEHVYHEHKEYRKGSKRREAKRDGAPCPAEIYSMQGNFYNPSPYCEFYEELIRFAFKMIAENEILPQGRRLE